MAVKKHMVKLHARAGIVTLHLGDDEHEVQADGTVEVPAEHIDAALSVGCSRTPIQELAPVADPTDKLAELEARIAVLEAAGAKKR
jgi:hypothetical protein